jgi:hypothetical protein
MIKVKVPNIGITELFELRNEILKSGLKQDLDFTFSFYPSKWCEYEGDIPSWVEFKFEDEKRCTLFLLKNSNRASVIS